MSHKIILEFKSTRNPDKNVKVFVPVGYRKTKLPYFTEWVTALESGKYRQADHVLKRTINKKSHYCCLGLLSKVQGRLTPNGFDGKTNHACHGGLSGDNPLYSELSDAGELPRGCFVETSDDSENFKIELLVELNDDADLTFKEIAKIIRAYWKP